MIKRWLPIAVACGFLAGCESPIDFQVINPVQNTVKFTEAYPTVAEVDEAPTVIEQIAPEYPSMMKRLSANGEATIVVVVMPDGKPAQAQIEQATHPRFGEAALDAVKRWRFKPGRKGGKIVPTVMSIPVQFRPESEN
jgi:TonB family protein